jgi:hypothetical protein
MVATYLGLVELGKARFFHAPPPKAPLARRRTHRERRVHRVASRWSRRRIDRRRAARRT